MDEFRTLNRCLDNGIALAVTEFNFQRDSLTADRQERELNEQIGFLAHELRNYLNTATLALFALTDGNLGITGATGTVLNRSLVGMRTLIDRSLADVRMTAGLSLRDQLFSLADFIAELKLSATLEAQLKNCPLVISAVDLRLAVDGDRDLLLSALGNLLPNAFKFTHPGTEVVLSAYAQGDRILIDVEDHGDGLLPEDAEKLFEPFSQVGRDKTGLGLGAGHCTSQCRCQWWRPERAEQNPLRMRLYRRPAPAHNANHGELIGEVAPAQVDEKLRPPDS